MATEVPARHRKGSPAEEKWQALAFIRLEGSPCFVARQKVAGVVCEQLFVNVTDSVHGHSTIKEVVVITGFLPLKNSY